MIELLIQPHIIKLKPYTCARDLYKEGTFLDANENPFNSSVALTLCDELNRYPDPDGKNLKQALGAYLDVSPMNIFVGVGSNEIIDLLVRLFAGPRDEMMVLEPTYGLYRIIGEINGTKVKTCLLTDDFQIDFTALEKAKTSKTKILFCCSPNSPTGSLLRTQDIEKLCKTFKGIVVLDEAYVEFSSQPTLIKKTEAFENLVVLRTLSKAWGLAGLRVGYAVANRTVIEYLNKIKPPYNIAQISLFLATKALTDKKKMEKMVEKILTEREKMLRRLEDLDCMVFHSETNFLLVRIANASQKVKELAENFGIIVRDFSDKPKLQNCMRITIGTPEENERFLSAFASLL
ncbi:MAG: histidinol-phosphate transaminase [Patescibacteria group bacterium]